MEKGFLASIPGGAVMTKILINVFLILLFVMSFPFIAFSEEIYEYERAWPVLEQPWYFTRPNGIAVDSNGNVYVADTENQRIQKFTPNGQFVTKWGSSGSENGQFGFPSGIAVDSSGNVYVADTNNHRIQKFTSNGQFTAKWGSYGSGDGQFGSPSGIAVDNSGNVYIADTNNHRIQKFTSNGQFTAKWGSSGSGNGQFNRPSGIALDNSGNVYVADTWNQRIQKFTSNGQFTAKWGSSGSGDGQFGFPSGIALDNNGNIYVADTLNYRIQKFTPNGQFAAKWGSEGNGDGQFDNPYGIAVDNSGNVYVADTENQRIQKFTNDGEFVTKWGSEGSADGQFFSPQSIAVDSSGNVYVADTNNHRIQKFKSNGQFIAKWGSVGSEDGQFNSPQGIAVDSSGYVYVADTENCLIQKFTTDGEFVAKWGSQGSADGQFDSPYGVAVDNNNYVYVTDVNNYRIQKFTTDGEFITQWGSEGSGDGQFYSAGGIAVDSSGNIYVADTENQRIQKFTTDGEFITKWGSEGSGDKQFYFPQGIAVDSSGNVYVADTENHRIQKFTSNGEFVTKWGSSGNNVGEFSYEEGIAIGSDGKVYVSDTGNNRIQVFGKVTTKPLNNKAIIVAGGGPFKGNNLWDATQMNANFAYRTLISQGYTNDTIYYLSSDRNVDLNGDGKPDVDADATSSSLQDAITQWAKDADSLVVYLIDHGGPGTFRMSEAEVLKAEDLASWLNELQETMQGLMTVIYDACESGSFVSKLKPPSGRQRITITSTSPGESAYFLNTGTLSFSYLFWSQVFGGGTIYWAYVMAKDGVGVVRGIEKDQNPQIDGNGNGIGNEKADSEVAKNKYIGKGFTIAGDIPIIGTISQDQILSGQTSATITVENIVTTGRITRVWAIVHSPDFTSTSDNPITDLPTFDLTWNEQNRRYEGTYNGFTVRGTYTVTVYATNEEMIISLPKTTKVEQLLHTLYTLTVVKSGTGSGTVISSPAGINCGDDCSETYSKVQKVKLTAKTDATSTFTGWSGGGCSGTKTCAVTVDAAVTVTADFALKIPDISVAQTCVDFGSIKVGKKGTKTLKIGNNGSGDLSITLSGLEGTDFTIQGSSSVTLKAKKSYSLKVLFTPKSTGLETATLRITSNDPDTPTMDIPLTGTGL